MYSRRVALFVLRDEKGKILLQHRSKDTERLPDHWAFFGGEIENGETPEKAVKREAKEELDIELKDFKLFKRYVFKDANRESFVFVAKLEHTVEQLRKQQKEGQNLGLFSFEELNGLKIIKNDMIILRDLFNK